MATPTALHVWNWNGAESNIKTKRGLKSIAACENTLCIRQLWTYYQQIAIRKSYLTLPVNDLSQTTGDKSEKYFPDKNTACADTGENCITGSTLA